MDIVEACMNCKFWQRDGADGICRRNNPRPEICPLAGGETLGVVWPRTNGGEWCGEFKLYTE